MDAVVSERSHVVVLKGDQSQTNLPQPSTRKLATHGDPVAVKRAKSKSKVPQASMRELFQFASAGDWALIIIAAIGSLACGACMPLLIYFFSASIETIGQTSSSNSFDMNEGAAQAISMVLTGVAFWATTALYMAAMDIAKTRQIAKYKKAYLKSIVRQDVGWFDVNSPQTLASKIGESIVLIEEGISNKFIQFFENLGTGLGCFVLAMYYAWDVALVVVATMPIVALAGVLLNHVQQNSQRTIGAAYATAGGVASEALYSIRTVAAFGLEKRLHSLYKASLAKAEKAAIRESWLAGFAFSTFLASPFLMIAVGLYYGGAILYLGRKDRFRREHTPEPPHVTPAATPPFALLSLSGALPFFPCSEWEYTSTVSLGESVYDGLLTAANVTSATLNYCINTTCSSDQYNSLYLSDSPLVGTSCKDVGLEPFRFTCLTTGGQADTPLIPPLTAPLDPPLTAPLDPTPYPTPYPHPLPPPLTPPGP